MCLHPDKGGSTELMALLTETYESVKAAMELAQKKEEMKNRNAKPKEQATTYHGNYRPAKTQFVNGFAELKIVTEMLKKSHKIKDFDSSFVYSVAEYIQERSFCTQAQYNALVRLYERFRFYDID